MTTNTTIGSSGTTTTQQPTDTMGPSSSGTSPADLQNTFLTLLVTQLQNQDPTDPMDSSQMTSQLAQIDTVTGISQLNTSLSSLSSQLSASEATQDALLVGQPVLVDGNSFSVKQLTDSSGNPETDANGNAVEATSAFGVQLASAATDLQITVKNSDGQVVSTIDLGKQAAGVLPITSWTPVDNQGNPLPEGSYTFSAQDAGAASDATAPVTLSQDVVQSVLQQPDGSTQFMLTSGHASSLGGIVAIL